MVREQFKHSIASARAEIINTSKALSREVPAKCLQVRKRERERERARARRRGAPLSKRGVHRRRKEVTRQGLLQTLSCCPLFTLTKRSLTHVFPRTTVAATRLSLPL